MRQKILIDGMPLEYAVKTLVPEPMKIKLRKICNEKGMSESEFTRDVLGKAIMEIISAQNENTGKRKSAA